MSDLGEMQNDGPAPFMPAKTREFVNDGALLALWGLKLDTYDIAGRLNMRESDVANRLAFLRDQAPRA